jgi:hypothetical protein
LLHERRAEQNVQRYEFKIDSTTFFRDASISKNVFDPHGRFFPVGDWMASMKNARIQELGLRASRQTVMEKGPSTHDQDRQGLGLLCRHAAESGFY